MLTNSVTDLMNISELNQAELDFQKDEEKCDEYKAVVALAQ